MTRQTNQADLVYRSIGGLLSTVKSTNRIYLIIPDTRGEEDCLYLRSTVCMDNIVATVFFTFSFFFFFSRSLHFL
ncbi:hypothetical protein BO71DRAFT_98809 [Aspergillus ellipticus CBS 707.79]|uniref:Uncharacterized protein n=1 Tax=Aspergillus ellipticus CBS 707.79 TaxID=1448320 RepID=A0A319EFL8_9EURO|nr:hypothetical protein BO71DRAFT_98809 [Aspergillus ellipticus CBS 707.79]